MRKLFVSITAIAAISMQLALAGEPYHFLKEIKIGGEGGWDCLSIDSTAHRLYVTHSIKIDIVDLDSEKVIGEIGDTPGVHGFAIAPALGLGFSSNGQESKASIVDLKTLRTVSKVETGENPDGILYEPKRQEVYVFNARGNSATVFEARTGKVLSTIPLAGNPEFAVADTEAGRVYVNIENKSEVAVIDINTHQVTATWPLAPGEEPTGIAFDPAHKRLFIACHNKLMVMMDSGNGKVVATVPIGAGVDGTAFDPGTKLAFSSNGEGNVTIAKEESPERLSILQTLVTQRGARTMALDPTTHKIYLATADFEPMPSPSPGAPRQRPKIIPGTMRVLVYEMNR